jgi:hypothetical protein
MRVGILRFRPFPSRSSLRKQRCIRYIGSGVPEYCTGRPKLTMSSTGAHLLGPTISTIFKLATRRLYRGRGAGSNIYNNIEGTAGGRAMQPYRTKYYCIRSSNEPWGFPSSILQLLVFLNRGQNENPSRFQIVT